MRLLTHTLGDFHQYLQRVRKASVQYRMRVRPSNSEHREILEAIRQGNSQEAEKAAYGHIANTIENLKNFDIEKVLREEMK